MPGVYYHLSRYISHRRAGEAYIRCLRRAGVPLAAGPGDADVAIIHDDPLNYSMILDGWGARPKRVIAYAVWEAERLPRAYVGPLGLVDEIWTCSEFSRAAFAGDFGNVSVLPHVVERGAVAAGDLAAMRERIGWREGGFYFYAITDSVNPRKNLPGLLRTFAKTFMKAEDVRLVVKQYREPLDLRTVPGVVDVREELSDSMMAALHEVCDCFVSMHHSEAWGLGMSEAMAHGNPVVATGYSGNMEYMDAKNSYPARFEVVPVSGEMRRLIPLYEEGMHWAEPDAGHFAYLMRRAAAGRDPKVGEKAALITSRFGEEAVARRLVSLLEGAAG